jgi:hypothetical protein
MAAKTIDEVLAQLSAIIDDCIKTNSRAGYFAVLYYKVTYSVQQGILNNQFEDGERMELLDVTFANRYLNAYTKWKAGEPTTSSWRVAFETVEKATPLILQQLFLGMNAHINLDLGIATVEAMRGKVLQSVSRDFNNINMVISSLTNEVITSLNRVSPLLSLLGLHATNYNSILIQFSIDSARDGAWRFAEDLSGRSDYDACIMERDESITQLAESLVHANTLLKISLWVIYLFEWKRPARVIAAMHDKQKRFLKVGEMQ